jgi:hypothetical protein
MELKNGSTTEQEIDQSTQRTKTIVSGVPAQGLASSTLPQVPGG